MEHTLVRLIMGGVLEALYQITITRLLPMKHRAAYHTIKTLDYLIVMTLKDLGLLPTPARVGAVILFDLVLPVLLSYGSAPQRILRALLVELDVFLTELLGAAVYITVFDHSVESMQTIGQESVASMATVYLILTLTSAFLFELTVEACNRSSKSDESYFSMPTILLILSAFIVFAVDYARFLEDSRLQSPNLVCAWLALGSVYLVFLIARRDAASQREAADSALAARKARHTVTEVRAMTWRAKGLAALRHELASDMREIPRLAGSGQVDEAARELSDLVEQARILNSEKG